MSRNAMSGVCTFLLGLWLGMNCFAQTATVTSTAEDLAARIAAAQTEAERTALLEGATKLQISQFVQALVVEADKRRDKGGYKEALPLYTLAQTAAERGGDTAGAALALDRMGNVYYRQDDYQQAIKSLQQSLALRRQLGDKKAIAETMDNLGKVYQWQEDFPKAQEHYSQALALSEEIGDKKGLARTLQNWGSLYQGQGQYQLAVEHFRQSLRIKEELGDTEGAAITINSLGGTAYYLSDFAQAAEHFQRALNIFEALGQAPRVGQVRGNLAQVETQLGNYDLALELSRQSLVAAESAGNKNVAKTALSSIGNIYFYRGDTARSLEYYQQALARAEQIGTQGGIGIILYNIAGVYDRQGNLELALDYFQKALVQRAAGEDKEGVASSLNRIGQIYRAQGDYARALEHFQRSLVLNEEMKDRNGAAEVMMALGDLYSAQKNLSAAIAQYQQALKIYEENGIKRNAVTALNSLAGTYLEQGNYAQSLEYAEASATLIRQLNSLIGLPAAHTTAGRALRALKQPARAEQSFAEAIKAIEALREFVAGGEREQQLFFSDLVAPYYEMVELLIAQGRLAEALDFAERAKGRVLLDILKGGRANSADLLTAAEQMQERRLANELTSLNAQLARERQLEKPEPQRITTLEAALPKARREYEAFENLLYAAHPELKLKRGETRVLNLKQATELLPDTRGALLEYVVADDRTYLLVLTRAGSNVELRAYSLAVKRKELAEKVENFRRALAERDLEFSKPARALYDLLLAPAHAQLENKTNLVIVPDGALWELPFQALQSAPNRFLLEQSALSYAPSLSVLYEIEARQRKRTEEKKPDGVSLLAFGNPTFGKVTVSRAQTVLRSGATLEPLPEAENEVKALAQIYGAPHSRVYTGAEAREARAKEDAGQFTMVHFATHGVFNDASPMYSHLMLAGGGDDEDGLLEAWEIMKLNLRADLVVLSACETGRGRVGAGEGLIGLSWAMFVAGSPTTVVSQWKVASGATRQLMIEFHRRLKTGSPTRRAGSAKAEALRAASLRMMRSGEFRHPFYWASFVIIGSDK